MSYNLFVQSIALVALAVFAISFHSKTRSRILFVNTVSLIIWTVHFSLLHAWSGVILEILNILITIFFIFREKDKRLDKVVFVYLAIAALVIGTLFTWEGFYSVFALIGVSIMTISKWQNHPQKLRFVAIFASVSWIVYDYFVGSSGGIISECVIILSLLISIARSKK